MKEPRPNLLNVCTVLVSALCLVLAVPVALEAHPMGNFSISHYSGLRIEPGWVELRYILDMAEIPTFQVMQETGIVAQADDPRVEAYLERQAELLKGGLILQVDGQPLTLEAVLHDVIFTPGAGGLPTMKMGFVYRAALPPSGRAASGARLDYRDENFATRAGWKEVVAVPGPGVVFQSSSAPTTSRSGQLANYPTDLLNSPPQALEARVSFNTAGSAWGSLGVNGRLNSAATHQQVEVGTISNAPKVHARIRREPESASRVKSLIAMSSRPNPEPGDRPIAASQAATAGLRLQPNAQPTPRNRFTQLVTSQQWGFWFLLTAALIAAGLGGLHALEPGHGKTLVAAYLVGSKSKATHAFLLGMLVTATHTAGVYALGVVTLYASKYIVPDHLYPWLGVSSGLTIAILGGWMLLRRWRGHSRDHGHDHSHPHEHAHAHDFGAGHGHEHEDHHQHGHPHGHPHGHQHEHGHAHAHAQSGSYRELVTLGVTGGILPCPAALVVLLSAVSLHRIGFGLFLIIAFSVGLAAVLIAVGLLTVFASRLMASRLDGHGALLNRWLPMASAGVITVLGMAIAAKALVTVGIVPIRF